MQRQPVRVEVAHGKRPAVLAHLLEALGHRRELVADRHQLLGDGLGRSHEPVDQTVAPAQQIQQHQLALGLLALRVDKLAVDAQPVDLLERHLVVPQIRLAQRPAVRQHQMLELRLDLHQPVVDGLQRHRHLVVAHRHVVADLEALLEQAHQDRLSRGHRAAAGSEELAIHTLGVDLAQLLLQLLDLGTRRLGLGGGGGELASDGDDLLVDGHELDGEHLERALELAHRLFAHLELARHELGQLRRMAAAIAVPANDLAQFRESRAKRLQIGLGVDAGLLQMVEQLLHTAQLRERRRALAAASDGEEEEAEQRKDVVERRVDAVVLEHGRVVLAVGIGLVGGVVVVRGGAGSGGGLRVGLLLVSDGVEAGDLLYDLLVELLHVVRADEFGAVLLERGESVADVDERLEDGQLLVRDARHARHGVKMRRPEPKQSLARRWREGERCEPIRSMMWPGTILQLQGKEWRAEWKRQWRAACAGIQAQAEWGRNVRWRLSRTSPWSRRRFEQE
ncbi:hypothetical protein L1887_53361 [Cichorium endivia]|nr:hypothetical protein L1887_53361 [Cichorium endivia]